MTQFLVPRQVARRILRFLRKPTRDKFSAFTATLKSTIGSSTQQDPGVSLVGHSLGAPRVLGGNHPRYCAIRPEADWMFGQYPEMRQLAAAWVANNPANAGDLPRLYSLALNIRQVLAEGVPGDFGELGVYRGNSAAVLALYARQYRRTVALFDTFRGFDRRDFNGVDQTPQTAFVDTSLEAVRCLVGEDRVRYVPGWFPESIPDDLVTASFSVVHLDCDLYAPIRSGMEWFFPRLSPGGIVIVHDYSNPHWPGVRKAVDEYLTTRSESVTLLPDRTGTALIRKQKQRSQRNGVF